MRRPGPRRLAEALDRARAELAPVGLLAAVQAAWPSAVGETVAREAVPVTEHGGRVDLRCTSATWAHELELLSTDLVDRLNAALSEAGSGHVGSLRFTTAATRSRNR